MALILLYFYEWPSITLKPALDELPLTGKKAGYDLIYDKIVSYLFSRRKPGNTWGRIFLVPTDVTKRLYSKG